MNSMHRDSSCRKPLAAKWKYSWSSLQRPFLGRINYPLYERYKNKAYGSAHGRYWEVAVRGGSTLPLKRKLILISVPWKRGSFSLTVLNISFSIIRSWQNPDMHQWVETGNCWVSLVIKNNQNVSESHFISAWNPLLRFSSNTKPYVSAI